MGKKRCAYSSGWSSPPSEPSSSTSSASTSSISSAFAVRGRISSSPEDAPSSLRAAAHASITVRWQVSRRKRDTHAACLGGVAGVAEMRCCGRNGFYALMDDRRSSIDARRNANFEEGPYGWLLMSKTCGGHVNLKLGGGAQRVVARAAAKNWGLSKLSNLPKFLDHSDRTAVYTRQHHTTPHHTSPHLDPRRSHSQVPICA